MGGAGSCGTATAPGATIAIGGLGRDEEVTVRVVELDELDDSCFMVLLVCAVRVRAQIHAIKSFDYVFPLHRLIDEST